jgi:hypothetical protein
MRKKHKEEEEEGRRREGTRQMGKSIGPHSRHRIQFQDPSLLLRLLCGGKREEGGVEGEKKKTKKRRN